MNQPEPPAIPEGQAPRCNGCAHYYITHESHFPYGCRALGFKSQQQPVRVVMEASAQQCLYFQPRR